MNKIVSFSLASLNVSILIFLIQDLRVISDFVLHKPNILHILHCKLIICKICGTLEYKVFWQFGLDPYILFDSKK